ncbi:hypothetical protein KGA66_27360, partial [Actinocrinis puniceicyclus]
TPVISNTTGQPLTPHQLNPTYWTQHLTNTVHYHHTITHLHTHNTTTYLELGPDDTLCAMASMCIADEAGTHAFIPTMQRRRPEVSALLGAFGHLHVRGIAVDWSAQHPDADPHCTDLPTYAFQEKSYWLHAPRLVAGPETGADAADADDVAESEEDCEPDSEFLRSLAEATVPEGEKLVLRLVLEHAAQVLGHESAEEMDPESSFLELGFSSFTALELNNRIVARTGFQIPAAAVFDHPTPLALARYLRAELAQSEPTALEPAG